MNREQHNIRDSSPRVDLKATEATTESSDRLAGGARTSSPASWCPPPREEVEEEEEEEEELSRLFPHLTTMFIMVREEEARWRWWTTRWRRS